MCAIKQFNILDTVKEIQIIYFYGTFDANMQQKVLHRANKKQKDCYELNLEK